MFGGRVDQLVCVRVCQVLDVFGVDERRLIAFVNGLAAVRIFFGVDERRWEPFDEC